MIMMHMYVGFGDNIHMSVLFPLIIMNSVIYGCCIRDFFLHTRKTRMTTKAWNCFCQQSKSIFGTEATKINKMWEQKKQHEPDACVMVEIC